jgi:hypothetical protein
VATRTCAQNSTCGSMRRQPSLSKERPRHAEWPTPAARYTATPANTQRENVSPHVLGGTHGATQGSACKQQLSPHAYAGGRSGGARPALIWPLSVRVHWFEGSTDGSACGSVQATTLKPSTIGSASSPVAVGGRVIIMTKQDNNNSKDTVYSSIGLTVNDNRR